VARFDDAEDFSGGDMLVETSSACFSDDDDEDEVLDMKERGRLEHKEFSWRKVCLGLQDTVLLLVLWDNEEDWKKREAFLFFEAVGVAARDCWKRFCSLRCECREVVSRWIPPVDE